MGNIHFIVAPLVGGEGAVEVGVVGDEGDVLGVNDDGEVEAEVVVLGLGFVLGLVEEVDIVVAKLVLGEGVD